MYSNLIGGSWNKVLVLYVPLRPPQNTVPTSFTTERLQLHKSVNYLIWSINNALKIHLIAFVWCTHIWDKVDLANVRVLCPYCRILRFSVFLSPSVMSSSSATLHSGWCSALNASSALLGPSSSIKSRALHVFVRHFSWELGAAGSFWLLPSPLLLVMP